MIAGLDWAYYKAVIWIAGFDRMSKGQLSIGT